MPPISWLSGPPRLNDDVFERSSWREAMYRLERQSTEYSVLCGRNVVSVPKVLVYDFDSRRNFHSVLVYELAYKEQHYRNLAVLIF